MPLPEIDAIELALATTGRLAEPGDVPDDLVSGTLASFGLTQVGSDELTALLAAQCLVTRAVLGEAAARLGCGPEEIVQAVALRYQTDRAL